MACSGTGARATKAATVPAGMPGHRGRAPDTRGMGWAITAAAALLAAALVVILAGRARLRARNIAGAAAAGAALAAVVASEFAIDGAGDWWPRHPNTAAVFAGAPLLLVTGLLVDAAVRQAFANAERRRWEPAGRVAAEALVFGLARPICDFQPVLWTAGKQVERQHRGSGVSGLTAAAHDLESAVRAVVLSAAPVLTATSALHDIYAHALRVVPAAARLAAELDWWEREQGEQVMHMTTESESTRLSFWGTVSTHWPELCDAARQFDLAARQWLLAETELGDEPNPWDLLSPAEFRDALAAYLAEYAPPSA